VTTFVMLDKMVFVTTIVTRQQ